MRSLDEFYKYIEKQEQALREQNTSRLPEPTPREPAPPPIAAEAPPSAAPVTPLAVEPPALMAEAPPNKETTEPEPPAPRAETETHASPAAGPASAEGFVPPPLPPRTQRPSRYESILPPEALRSADAAPRGNGHHRPAPAPSPTTSDIRYLMRGGITVPARPASRAVRARADTDVLPDIEAYIPALRDPEAEPDVYLEIEEEDEEEADADGAVTAEDDAAPAARVPVTSEEAAALWGRLPRHIQLLFSMTEDREEVAQKYYTRGFKESRRELIERLLNPTLTLEEAARVLGVCPTTVRRYTNRGVLPHHRTVGQQRRFRLSDVLAFLERSSTGRGDPPDEENDEDDEDAA